MIVDGVEVKCKKDAKHSNLGCTRYEVFHDGNVSLGHTESYRELVRSGATYTYWEWWGPDYKKHRYCTSRKRAIEEMLMAERERE